MLQGFLASTDLHSHNDNENVH